MRGAAQRRGVNFREKCRNFVLLLSRQITYVDYEVHKRPRRRQTDAPGTMTTYYDDEDDDDGRGDESKPSRGGEEVAEGLRREEAYRWAARYPSPSHPGNDPELATRHAIDACPIGHEDDLWWAGIIPWYDRHSRPSEEHVPSPSLFH